MPFKLTDEQRPLCEGPIKEKKLYGAIYSFQNSKSPGIDWIPEGIYKTFLPEIQEVLFACINLSLEIGQQSNSQGEELNSLLLKYDADDQAKHPMKSNN